MNQAPDRPDLRALGQTAFIEVLETLLRIPVSARDPADCTPLPDAPDRISSSVLLAGANLSGSVCVQFARGFVTQAAHILTGVDHLEAEANGLLDDTAGEIANMVAGRVAARLAERGYACNLGTPTISHYLNFPIENEAMAEHGRAAVICAGHPLAVEIQCRYTTPRCPEF